MARVVMSVAPPAAKPTKTRIGRSGYAPAPLPCAAARSATIDAACTAKADARMRRRVGMGFLPPKQGFWRAETARWRAPLEAAEQFAD
jgi:hypothetical protein